MADVYTCQGYFHSSHSPLLPVSTSIFSTSVSLFLLCKQVEHLSKLKAQQVKLLDQDHIISYIIEKKKKTKSTSGIKLLFLMGDPNKGYITLGRIHANEIQLWLSGMLCLHEALGMSIIKYMLETGHGTVRTEILKNHESLIL